MRLENVSYTYPDGPTAVKNLSVSIHKGERVAVLGCNGAGKSTFFLLCNGVLEPAKGTIYCSGSPVTRKKKDLLELRRRVASTNRDAPFWVPNIPITMTFPPLRNADSRQFLACRV